jgi:hypothetical protein
VSNLRDARLKKALDSAPDAQSRPDARTRQAIHAHARAAVTSAAQDSWWRRLLGPDHRRMPWSAAFATVVMATLVTMLWQDREIPGARPDAAPAPPPQQPQQTQQPQPQPQPQPAPAAKPAPEPAPRRQELAKAPLPSRPTAQERSAERRVLKDEDSRALAKSGPQQTESARAADTAAAPPPPGLASAPAAGAAAGTPAEQMARSTAPAAPSAAARRAELPAPALWTHARITGAGRSVDIERSLAARLRELVAAVERGAQVQEPLEGDVTARLELSREGAVVEVLEIIGTQIRWTRLRAGERSSFIVKPDPAQLQALMSEIDRLLGR